jgi:DNA-binding MarR family transcriptional regulator
MQQHDNAEAQACAALLMELAPLVMRAMRKELTLPDGTELSVPQFRALRFLGRRPQASLSDLAEHLGTSLPAASKLVDRLLETDLVHRAPDPSDRRQVVLTLTDHGRTTLREAHAAAQARLSERLVRLGPEQLTIGRQALLVLQQALVEQRG